MNADKMRESLAAGMQAHLGIVLNDLTDALLPTVRKLMADEMRAASDALPSGPGLQYVAHDWLRDRARQIEAGA